MSGGPVFLLQIVDAQRKNVQQLPSGGKLERDLIAACQDAICKRGVGMFRTEAKVRQAIDEGITEVIRGLTKETRALV